MRSSQLAVTESQSSSPEKGHVSDHMSDSKGDFRRCVVHLCPSSITGHVLDPLLVLWTADKQEMRLPSCCALCCKLTTAVWDHPPQTLNLCTIFFLSNPLKKLPHTPPHRFFFSLHTKHFGSSSVGPSPFYCAVYWTSEGRKRYVIGSFASLCYILCVSKCNNQKLDFFLLAIIS